MREHLIREFMDAQRAYEEADANAEAAEAARRDADAVLFDLEQELSGAELERAEDLFLDEKAQAALDAREEAA